jgi:coiled-coil domain-containing protein 6
LELEKRRNKSICEELRLTKEQNLQVQKQVEQEEEYITNKLMKRLEQLKNEKQVLVNEVEQEEEYLVNNLHKRLEKLNTEKVDLENRLEVEQEYIVNKLQKKLDELSQEKSKLNLEKVNLENQLEAEQEYIVNKLQKQVERLGKEKRALQKEKADMQRQVTDLAGAVDKLNRDKVALENQMEMEEEGIVNRLQRQLEQLLTSYRVLEQKLEARGISVKELGNCPPIDTDTEWVYSRSPSKGTASRANSGELRLLGPRSVVGVRPISSSQKSLASATSVPVSPAGASPTGLKKSDSAPVGRGK